MARKSSIRSRVPLGRRSRALYMSQNQVSPPSAGISIAYIIVASPVRACHEPSVCHASVPRSGCRPEGLPSASRLDSR